jgi:carboxyl-terminal processing protease
MDEMLDLVRAGIGDGSVTLLLREPEGQEREVTLIPGDVDTDPVSWEMLSDGLGLIRIMNFEDRSGEQAIAAADELCAQGAKGLIFDVRANPGGQLKQLLEILDHLLPEGPIFISKDIRGQVETEESDRNCLSVPMAVLVNSDSYSAAEFFAAALQEYEWATVVGEKTTGKGYAQINLPLSDGSAIHVSSVEYFTPKGNSLAGIGLTPDLEVELRDELRSELEYGLLAPEEDTQLQAAQDLLQEKIADKP